MTHVLAEAGKSTNSAVERQYKTGKKANALRGEDRWPAAGRTLWPVFLLIGRWGSKFCAERRLPISAGFFTAISVLARVIMRRGA